MVVSLCSLIAVQRLLKLVGLALNIRDHSTGVACSFEIAAQAKANFRISKSFACLIEFATIVCFQSGLKALLCLAPVLFSLFVVNGRHAIYSFVSACIF